jgi:hypothetical protein
VDRFQEKLDLKSVLHDVFAAEGTVSVASLWDRGWTVRIGYREGVGAERTFSNEELDFDVLADWLARTFADLRRTTSCARKFVPTEVKYAATREVCVPNQTILLQPARRA